MATRTPKQSKAKRKPTKATKRAKATPRGAKATKATPRVTKAATPERILVENVNWPGQERPVDAGKYREVKGVLLSVLPKNGGLTQSEMVEAVRAKLTGDLQAKAGWWTKCVQLDLEAKGLVLRTTTSPLRWRRA